MKGLLWLCLGALFAGLWLAPEAVLAQMAPGSGAPVGLEDNSDSIAVVIGNRNYRDGTVPVEFAHNDAQAMKSWLISALGFREQNIIFRQDATLGDFIRIFGTGERADGTLLNRVKPGRSNVFVFYSGHGAPDVRPQAGERNAAERPAYLIPVDVSPEEAQLGYALDTLTRNLQKVRDAIGAKRWLVVMLDACFSGNSGGGAIVHTSGTFTPKPLGAGSGLVRVVAARRDQVANWDHKLKLGLLTSRFLLGASGQVEEAGNQGAGGAISWASLANYTDREVRSASRALFGRDQEPEIDEASINLRPFTVEQLQPAIAAAKDEAAWQRARQDDTPQAYADYLTQCADNSPCAFRSQALSRYADLQGPNDRKRDGELWEKARTSSSYEWYLSECARQKTGCYHKQAGLWEIDRMGSDDPPAPPPPTPLADEDTERFRSAQKIGAIQAFQAYLDGFPDGKFADSARKWVEHLAAPSSSPQRPPPPRPSSSSKPPLPSEIARYDGADLSGNDLTPTGVKVPSYNGCAALCRNDNRCRAFTFVTKLGKCFPKSAIGPSRPYPNGISGVLASRGAPPESPAQSQYQRLSGYDLPGNDMDPKGVYSPSYDACAKKCLATARCGAFTFNTRHNRCFLKTAAGHRASFAGAESGIVTGRPVTTAQLHLDIQPDTDIPDGDYNDVRGVKRDDCAAICMNDGECRAFSYDERSTSCRLKNQVGGPRSRDGIVSGIKSTY